MDRIAKWHDVGGQLHLLVIGRLHQQYLNYLTSGHLTITRTPPVKVH